MHKVIVDENETLKQNGQPPLTCLPKPCDYFDLIGGTVLEANADPAYRFLLPHSSPTNPTTTTQLDAGHDTRSQNSWIEDLAIWDEDEFDAVQVRFVFQTSRDYFLETLGQLS